MPQTDIIVKQEPIGDIGGDILPPGDPEAHLSRQSARHLPSPVISGPPPSAFNCKDIRVLSSGVDLNPSGRVSKGLLPSTKKSKDASDSGPRVVRFPNCKQGGERIGERLVVIGPKVSAGTYSEVHHVSTSCSDEKYAVKIVNLTKFSSKRSYESIMKEVSFLKKFTCSPYIIDLIAKTKVEEHGVMRLYFLLELAETDLRRMLLCRKQAGTPSNISFVTYWGGQVVEAVRAVHKQNVIHQDLKPDNFLVINGGLKLCDFGISKVIPDHADSVHTTDLRGTPMYMAPELANATNRGLNLTQAYDVWAIGIILYQLTYEAHPCEMSKDAKTWFDRARYEFPTVTDHGVEIPCSLFSVFNACLQEEPIFRPTIERLAKSSFFSNAIGN